MGLFSFLFYVRIYIYIWKSKIYWICKSILVKGLLNGYRAWVILKKLLCVSFRKKKGTIYLTRLDIDLIELTICNEVGNFLIRWKARRFVKDFVWRNLYRLRHTWNLLFHLSAIWYTNWSDKYRQKSGTLGEILEWM